MAIPVLPKPMKKSFTTTDSSRYMCRNCPSFWFSNAGDEPRRHWSNRMCL